MIHYIIDPENFNGIALATVGEDGIVEGYKTITFEDYKVMEKNDKLSLLTDKEFEELLEMCGEKYYTVPISEKEFNSPLIEVDIGEFNEAWARSSRKVTTKEMWFCFHAENNNETQAMYCGVAGNFYKAYRNINKPTSKIMADIKQELFEKLIP